MRVSSAPVLLAYDGSQSSATAIAVAGQLLPGRKAFVCHAWTGLLHFWEFWVAEAPALAALSRAVEGMAAELDETAEEQSSHLVEDGVELAEQSGFEATGLSERAAGPGWLVLRDAANQHACAAIVLGSQGLTGLSRALGSVSNGVVHNSRRPILVVPPEEES
jgi:nucleotide-binding universal stress UspA family protein